jgi:adenylyl-sulfate kinase
MSGKVIWFTGLSGAGKSTLASALYDALQKYELKLQILDGDEVRTNLSKGLTFSKEDRDTNIRRIGYVAGLLSKHGVWVLVAAISPYRNVREELKNSIPGFVEIYCKADIESLKMRDPKGLYKKALAGQIKGFTGIDDPYEEPLNPDLTLETDKTTIDDSLAKILNFLKAF